MSDWRLDANCRGLDPALFFPGRADHEMVRDALAVCEGCTVRQQCLDYSFEIHERDGVWGGLPANRRRKMKSQMIARDRTVVCDNCGSEFLGHVRSRLCSDACRSARTRPGVA